jgi:hypothetical protein
MSSLSRHVSSAPQLTPFAKAMCCTSSLRQGQQHRHVNAAAQKLTDHLSNSMLH